MKNIELKLGNCINVLKKIEEKSIDMIFADPPYNLSGKKHLTVKSGKPVQNFKGDWDVVEDNAKFSEEWLAECIRVLKDDNLRYELGKNAQKYTIKKHSWNNVVTIFQKEILKLIKK